MIQKKQKKKCVSNFDFLAGKSYFNSSSFQQVKALTIETLRDIISL